MKKKRELGERVRATLTLASQELEASAQAARQAAGSLQDEKALWANIQQMYARLDQASHIIAGLRTLSEGVARVRAVGDEKAKR